MPAASAAPAAGAAGAPAADAEPEKAAPKEKTVFNVNLTKIDAAQKAKAIKEVKAIMPGMNLVEVRFLAWKRASERDLEITDVHPPLANPGQEVCRVAPQDAQGERNQG